MGVCGSKGGVIVPTTAEKAASPPSIPSHNSSAPKPTTKPAKAKKQSDDSKPVEYRSDPSLTEAEREERRRKLAEAAEARLKSDQTKGMTKAGTVEYEYMLKHQKDLEKYKKLDDGKNLDWNGT